MGAGRRGGPYAPRRPCQRSSHSTRRRPSSTRTASRPAPGTARALRVARTHCTSSPRTRGSRSRQGQPAPGSGDRSCLRQPRPRRRRPLDCGLSEPAPVREKKVNPPRRRRPRNCGHSERASTVCTARLRSALRSNSALCTACAYRAHGPSTTARALFAPRWCPARVSRFPWPIRYTEYIDTSR